MYKMIKPLSDFLGQFFKRYAPAFITLIVIAGAFYFYSNVIIKQNERTIRERSFRGLNRMGGNIREKIQLYAEKNSVNFLKDIKDLPDSLRKRTTDPAITRIEAEYGLQQFKDSPVLRKQDYFSLEHLNEWEIIFNTGATMRAGAPVTKFIRSFLRRDLFNYYFLAHNDTVLFDEINLSHDTLTSIARGRLVKDTLTKQTTKEFGAIEQVETGGKKYKLFMIPFTVKGNHHFVIGGYMPVEDYLEESRYIPGNAILWLVLGVVLVILMFPLLKVFLMTRAEPLLARNVLTSLISIHLMGSIIIIILVNLYAYYFLIRKPADEQLRTLTAGIQQTFLSEVKDVLGEMDLDERELLKLINQQGGLPARRFPDLYSPEGDNTTYRIDHIDTGKPGNADIVYKPDSLGKRYRYFEQIVWTDSNGMQAIRWTSNPFVPRKVDLRDRDYFQAVAQRTLLRRDNQEYFLTAVSSWVSQQKLAIIARPSRLKELLETDTIIKDPALRKSLLPTLGRMEMISMSAPLRSLFNPILPYGFGFCLVDGRGNVLFHYDENRSLNENLVEEANDNVKLSSLLTTGAAGYFNAHYTGSNHRFYAQPVDRIPYYLVSFYDIENNWNQDLDIMSASSILVLINMGIILLLVLITRILSFRRLSRSILFIWVEPKLHRGNAYLKAAASFVLASILLFLFSFFSNKADELYLLGISLGFTHILIVYSYFVYTRADMEKDKIAGTMAARVRRLEKNNLTIVILVVVYLLVAWLFLNHLTEGDIHFFWSQFLLVIGLWAISRYLPPKGKTIGKEAYRQYYYYSLFGFILATAIVPTLLFFALSFREEQKLAVKYQQLDFVNTLLYKKPYRFYKHGTSWNVSYHAPFHYTYLADTIVRDTETDTLRRAITGFGKLYNGIKPSFSAYAKRIEYLNGADSTLGNFTWDDSVNSNSLRFRIDILKTKTYAEGDYRILAVKKMHPVSHLLATRFAQDPEIHILLLLIMGLILAGIYLVLVQLIPKVFFFNKTDTASREMISKTFIKSLNPVNHVYVQGIINSGKYNLIRASLEAEHYTILPLDIALLFAGDAGSKEGSMFEKQWAAIVSYLNGLDKNELALRKTAVVIRHFDMKMDDLDATDEKLKRLELLLSYKFVKVVISSSKHFEAMLIKEPETTANAGKPRKDFTDRWLNVMNNFCMFYHKWQYDEQRSGAVDTAGDKNYDVYFLGRRLDDKLTKECAHSEFLYGLLLPLRQSLVREWLTKATVLRDGQAAAKPDTEMLFESFCVKLRALAHHYYLSLWQSLSAEEQRTIYDIASDGLLNQRNQDVADNLYALGMLRINASGTGYWMMNESFRGFVLTRIDKKEISKLHDGTDPGHSWNRFQLPVILVVVAVALFLFTTQRDAFNNLVTYLAAAAGGIAALLRILDVFSAPKVPGG